MSNFIPTDLPVSLPILTLQNVIVLPFMQKNLHLFEPASIDLFNDCLTTNRLIGIIQPQTELSTYRFGCAARITAFTEIEHNLLLITVTGVCRFEIQKEIRSNTTYKKVETNWYKFIDDLHENRKLQTIDRTALIKNLGIYFKALKIKIDWLLIQKMPNHLLINFIAMYLNFTSPQKQRLLEAVSLTERYTLLVEFVESLLLSHDICRSTKH